MVHFSTFQDSRAFFSKIQRNFSYFFAISLHFRHDVAILIFLMQIQCMPFSILPAHNFLMQFQRIFGALA